MAMSFDQHSNTAVLYMMRGMSFFPDIGLEQRQHEPSEFIVVIDHDLPFRLGFIPTESYYDIKHDCTRRR